MSATILVGVGYRYKFTVQIAVGVPVGTVRQLVRLRWEACSVSTRSRPWVGCASSRCFIVVYVTNAINLIDGIDGLASGLCCIALSVLSVIFFHSWAVCLRLVGYLYAGNPHALSGATTSLATPTVDISSSWAMPAALTLGYVISFLIIHLMRDRTSTSTAASESLYGDRLFHGAWYRCWTWSVWCLRRLREHKNPFLPDKNHFHHKLLRTGMRVRMVMVCIIAISAFFILLNSSLAWRVDITYLFFLNLFCWSILHVGLNGLIKRNRERKESEQLR